MLTISVQLYSIGSLNACVGPFRNDFSLFKASIAKVKLMPMPERISIYDRRKQIMQKPLRAVMMDPWAPGMNSQSIASQLFAVSLFPYLGFLYYITKSKSAPPLTLFGFYFLLAFVGATIPAGIYASRSHLSLYCSYLLSTGHHTSLVSPYIIGSALCTSKIHYGTSLSNVDWLHGSAESLLTLTNLFIVLGLREGLRKEEIQKVPSATEEKKEILEEERSSI